MNWSVGCRSLELFDEPMGVAFPVLVLYPSPALQQPEQFGPYTLDVARDGALAEGVFALVVISHGTGSSHLVMRDLGAHLARNGFVVAMLEHPRNNRNNNDLAYTAANLENRPRHVRLVVDWAVAEFGTLPGIALVGHSLGGYTALAVAGGHPAAFAHECPDQQARPLVVTPDARVQALVLLAPATCWFLAPGALNDVRLPILMLTAEQDPHTPGWHGEIVKRGVRDACRVEHRVVPNAGHFSFLSPFPAAMTNPAFPPSQDPPGFDRESFHREMNAEVLEFLRQVL